MVEQKNKYLEELISQGILEEIARLLNIEVPKIKYIDMPHEHFVMQARGNKVGPDVFISMNEIQVNIEVLKLCQDEYAAIACSEDAAYDYTQVVLFHEFRHLWQYDQEECTPFLLKQLEQERLKGIKAWNAKWKKKPKPHGHEPLEKDANDWMMYVSSFNSRLKAIATRARWVQDVPERYYGMYYTADIVKQYNAEAFSNLDISMLSKMGNPPAKVLKYSMIEEEDEDNIIDIVLE